LHVGSKLTLCPRSIGVERAFARQKQHISNTFGVQESADRQTQWWQLYAEFNKTLFNGH
jgi:hypothetical protein